ncbi:GntR family transcriptional regulator, partial [Listeria seeligeri]|uniref:GntR family transcriptional regulator n=1 Tax=Listeria seeligeri TaxID=1640 RepID=UPI0018889D75
MSGMAKYMEIYIDIRDKINQNKYEINEKLPDGDSMARTYDCSKLTVKKALDMLVQEGMIIGPMSGLVNTFGKDNIKSKVILFSIEKPSKEVAEKLEMQDDYIYRIIRMREVGHKAYSIEHTYMPLAIIPGLEPHHLEDSIYNYIRDDLKLKMQ